MVRLDAYLMRVIPVFALEMDNHADYRKRMISVSPDFSKVSMHLC